MDRYMKGFIVAALVYFALAAIGGILMGTGVDPSWLRFLHVHFNLLGFMSMMVYGIGYFILPRFNGKVLRFPGLVPVHFYTANVGLIGMVGTYTLRPSLAYDGFAILEGVSVGLFVFNIIATMVAQPVEEKREPEAAKEPILPGQRVGEVLKKYPGIYRVFVENGIAALADPQHRAQVEELPVTIMMASNKHGVPLEKLIRELNDFIGVKVRIMGAKPPAQKTAAGGLERGDRIEAGHILGDILAAYPETEPVFRKYYGDGCFSCPGQATESVNMSALMHNVSEAEILDELNRVVAVAPVEGAADTK